MYSYDLKYHYSNISENFYVISRLRAPVTVLYHSCNVSKKRITISEQLDKTQSETRDVAVIHILYVKRIITVLFTMLMTFVICYYIIN